jgi:hypothetical protein
MRIKCRLKEVIRLIVTRGAAVEWSRRGPMVVKCRRRSVDAITWCIHVVLITLWFLKGVSAREWYADWTSYCHSRDSLHALHRAS